MQRKLFILVDIMYMFGASLECGKLMLNHRIYISIFSNSLRWRRWLPLSFCCHNHPMSEVRLRDSKQPSITQQASLLSRDWNQIPLPQDNDALPPPYLPYFHSIPNA